MPWQSPLVHFHEAQLPAGRSLKRELGLALTQASFLERQVQGTQLALPRLKESLVRQPDDLPVLTAKGIALAQQGAAAEAMKAFEKILTLAPDYEDPLAWAGSLAEQLGTLERAEAHWRHLVNLSPYFSSYHLGLARVLAGRERWDEAATEARAALRLNHARLEVRKYLIK